MHTLEDFLEIYNLVPKHSNLIPEESKDSLDEHYTIDSTDEDLMKTVLAIANSEDSGKLWTIVSGDNGGLFLANGYHIVNRMGYLITEEEGEIDELYYMGEVYTEEDVEEKIRNAVLAVIQNCYGMADTEELTEEALDYISDHFHEF